jgi:ArsR family transcriptional regulator
MRPSERHRRRATLAAALAHPSRLVLLDLLEKGPRCAGELAAGLGAAKPTVSQHLAVLRRAGLIVGDRQGRHIHYRLACSCIGAFFTCLDTLTVRRPRSA